MSNGNGHAPRPISQVTGDDPEQVEFTQKAALENVALVITQAKLISQSKVGPFWVVEATRTDTGEFVVFTGSTVINKQMAAACEQSAFPVKAMIARIDADNQQGYYWELVDVPETPQDRTAQVKNIIAAGNVTADDVRNVCADIMEAPTLVRDLPDEAFAELMTRLNELNDAALAEAPF